MNEYFCYILYFLFFLKSNCILDHNCSFLFRVIWVYLLVNTHENWVILFICLNSWSLYFIASLSCVKLMLISFVFVYDKRNSNNLMLMSQELLLKQSFYMLHSCLLNSFLMLKLFSIITKLSNSVNWELFYVKA